MGVESGKCETCHLLSCRIGAEGEVNKFVSTRGLHYLCAL